MLSNLLLAANSTIAICYFAIAFLIWLGLKRGQQNLSKNPLVVATAAIFFTCALGHSAHVLLMVEGDRHNSLPLLGIQLGVDLITASVAVTFLALRQHYSVLIDGSFLLDQTRSQLAAANEKLAKVNVNLEHLVAERTTQLQQTNQELNREITERKQNEAALRQSQERLKLALEVGKMVYWDWDIAQDYLSVSENQAPSYGWTPDPNKGSYAEFYQRVHPEDKDAIALAVSAAIEDGTLNVEFRMILPDGSTRWMTSRGQVFYNGAGVAVRMLGTSMDISDRKQIEADLQQSNSILRTVVDSTTDAIFMKDLQSRYVFINSAGANAVGKPVEDIVGKDDTGIFPDDIALPIMENERRLIASGGNQTYEDLVSKRGELRTFLAVKTLCRNKQGKVIGVVGIARDITDRKHAEQQIKELNQDLERRVAERTKQLEAANKELEAFSYSVSHDLRAPLRSIDGFSLALAERYVEQLDDKGKHYLQRVRAASQRMGELIDDLLHLSRVTRSEMQCQTVDLSAMVQAIAADLQQTEPERQVEFSYAPEVVVQGDPRLLRVVFENLLNNAWKFTAKKLHPKIEFGTTPQSDGTIAYYVSDNGAGFDMTYANNLFGAFQRLHTIDEFPGTGIGLATVKRIIHRHGGRVWAEGLVEQGATFYFTLADQ